MKGLEIVFFSFSICHFRLWEMERTLLGKWKKIVTILGEGGREGKGKRREE